MQCVSRFDDHWLSVVYSTDRMLLASYSDRSGFDDSSRIRILLNSHVAIQTDTTASKLSKIAFQRRWRMVTVRCHKFLEPLAIKLDPYIE